MSQWIYIGLFFIVGLIVPVGAITVAWILGPKKPNPIKQSTYECGIETVGDSWVQFKAQYYIFALVFLVFDVETVFLFPWAVKLGQLGCLPLWKASSSFSSSLQAWCIRGARECWSGHNLYRITDKADWINPFSLFFV